MDADVVFESLLHQYRRNLLRYLSEYEETTTLHAVTEQITAWQTACDETPEDHYQQVATGLYHTHVPKLVDADVIELDEEREQITATKNVYDLSVYLDLWE